MKHNPNCYSAGVLAQCVLHYHYKLIRLGAIFVLLVNGEAVNADPTLRFANVPRTYTPGQIIDVEVKLHDVTNLAAYNIDVNVEARGTLAGSDFGVDSDITGPIAPGYVFDTTEYYLDSFHIDAPDKIRITLSDFNNPGAALLARNRNDRIASIRLFTSPMMTVPIELTFDTRGLMLDGVGSPFASVAEFDVILASIDQASMTIFAVPEPGLIEPLVVGLVGMFVLRVRRLKNDDLPPSAEIVRLHYQSK